MKCADIFLTLVFGSIAPETPISPRRKIRVAVYIGITLSVILFERRKYVRIHVKTVQQMGGLGRD